MPSGNRRRTIPLILLAALACLLPAAARRGATYLSDAFSPSANDVQRPSESASHAQSHVWPLFTVDCSPFTVDCSPFTNLAGPGDPTDPTDPGGDAEPTPDSSNPGGVDPSNPGYIPARLQQPALPANPTLAEKGAQTWWSVCMACHGDEGQGLTDEWRNTAFGEDNNCWNIKCHGPRHPPQGFTFPRIVPPAWGPGTLKRFVTADELQAYLLASMPWWNPGSLSVAQSWELTAFILTKNGVLSPGVDLDISAAPRTPVHLPVRDLDGERSWSMVWLGALALAAVGLIGLRSLKSEGRQGSRVEGQESSEISGYLGVSPLKRYARQFSDPQPSTLDPRPSSHRGTFFHHLHPATIPAEQARWRYTLGAGGLAVFLSLALLITGILEMFVYVPTPAEAAQSVQAISFLVPFGALVRGLHFWAAQALVGVAVLHLARVIFTGAYAPPRRFNYLLGLALLVVVLLLDFTGYMLRWDEGIRWALVVGTNLLKTIPAVGDGLYRFVMGGASPGAPALIRFYAWHIFGLTLVMAILAGWHIFRVRRDGGIAAPPPSSRISRFELVRREILAMLLAGVVLGLAAWLLPPALAPPIQDSPTALLADARAPWFFLWVQRLLRYGAAFWMGVAIPLLALCAFFALPYIFPAPPPEQRGRWFPPAGRLAQLAAALLLLGWLALTVMEIFR